MSGFGIGYLAGGRLDPPFMPTKVKPFIKGDTLQVSVMGAYRKDTPITLDGELLSVAVGCSMYEPKDYWNLYLDGDIICETVYTKNVPEGMFFLAVIPVLAGSTLTFEFVNNGGRAKYVWWNYQFLR